MTSRALHNSATPPSNATGAAGDNANSPKVTHTTDTPRATADRAIGTHGDGRR